MLQAGHRAWDPTRDGAFMRMDRSIVSLRKLSLDCVVRRLDHHVHVLPTLPYPVRAEVLRLACKRGLVRDDNMASLLVDGCTELDLSHSDAIGDATLSLVAQQCHYLTSVNLNWPAKGDDLSADSLTDEGLSQLAESCPNLLSVMCRNRGNVTGASVVAVARRCARLGALDVGGCRVDDSLLRALSETSQFLKSLNVSFTVVTSKGFEALCSSDSACFTTLEELHVTNCGELCDTAVRHIAKLPRLTIFIFHNCRLLTEQSRAHLDDILDRQQRRSRNIPRGIRRRPVQMSWTVY